MAFTSIVFLWCFLPLSFLVFLLKDKYRNTFLILISIIFYAWGEPRAVGVLLFSIVFNYLLVAYMDKLVKVRKCVFVFIICLNIGILFYYKYLYFVLNNIFALKSDIKNAILPVGISFYTFSILSYVIEVYRKNEKPAKNILDMGLYVVFFPKLVQGPIVKYSDFVSQLYSRGGVTSEIIYCGLTRVIIGLGKKTLVANVLSEVVDEIFSLEGGQLSTGVAWLGAICYTVQIYYDFSGYSDIAIGLGKIFGFNFKENFNYPYMAASVKDFWRRWHISLSSWFRDYIYIPLGGNRKGNVRTYINTFVVFVVTGMWHGANWTFWFWGVYHGVFQILESCLGKRLRKLKIMDIICTNLIVILGWVFFRADSVEFALIFIKNMFVYKAEISYLSVESYLNNKVLFVLIIGIAFAGILQFWIGKFKEYINLPAPVIEVSKGVLLMGIMFLSIMSLACGTYNSFIYFRF